MPPQDFEPNRVEARVPEHSVLFVDDEVNILKALQRLLRNEPIRVLTASRPAEAFELIDRHGPQVVVSDQRMPSMSGVDFLASVRNPTVQILVITRILKKPPRQKTKLAGRPLAIWDMSIMRVTFT